MMSTPDASAPPTAAELTALGCAAPAAGALPACCTPGRAALLVGAPVADAD